MSAGSIATSPPVHRRWRRAGMVAWVFLASHIANEPVPPDFEARRTIRQTFAFALPDDAPGDCAPTAAEWALYEAAKVGAPMTPRANRVDFFARWIHDHSSHDGSRPFLTRDIRFTNTIAQALLAHAFGGKEKPSLGCGHRNNILKKILHLDGIPARLVNLLGDGAVDGRSYGHVLLEYRDKYNKWLVADADFLIYWTDLSGRRIGISEALRLPFARIIPHGRDGKTGYETTDAEGKSPQIFADLGLFSAAIVLTDEPKSYDYVRFYLNPAKVAPDLPLEGKSYLERFGYLPTEFISPAPDDAELPITLAGLSGNLSAVP